MQIMMSMEEYEEFKRDYDNEVYKLEKECARLRKENEELTKENNRLTFELLSLRSHQNNPTLQNNPTMKAIFKAATQEP